MNILTRALPPLGAGLLLAGCATKPTVRPAQSAAPVAVITGVADCDTYLASYLACHRAAAVFPADQLPFQYQTMRDSLLSATHDPQTRPYMAARCRVLIDQLNQTLQGKVCTPPPPAASR